MKKIIFVFMFLILLVGCSLSNSPTSKVEDLLMKYQMLDNDIENNITSILDGENLNDVQKERYRNLIEKQYKGLSYEITDEIYDGDEAMIIAQIEVLDYKKAINDVSAYYLKQSNYTVLEYNEAKLDALEKVKDKVLYTIEFNVHKDKNGNWNLESLDNETIKKILGMY